MSSRVAAFKVAVGVDRPTVTVASCWLHCVVSSPLCLSRRKSATSFIAIIKFAVIVAAGACGAPVLCYDIDVLIFVIQLHKSSESLQFTIHCWQSFNGLSAAVY